MRKNKLKKRDRPERAVKAPKAAPAPIDHTQEPGYDGPKSFKLYEVRVDRKRVGETDDLAEAEALYNRAEMDVWNGFGGKQVTLLENGRVMRAFSDV